MQVASKQLIDRLGRPISYLRLSVTDRCDLRCRYCLPERPDFIAKKELLSLAELLVIAETFVSLGVSKIRVTGGEPLMRRDLPWLLERLARLPGLNELTLTTNGTRLAGLANDLLDAGVDRLNISLDTLSSDRFAHLTRNGDLAKVIDGIKTAASLPFKRLRLNTVLIPDVNHDELAKLVDFAIELGIDIAFIEEMPLGDLGRAECDHSLDSHQVLDTLKQSFTLMPSDANTGGPARYWQVAGSTTKVGLIAPHSQNFCTNCNRVRVACNGDLYPCLGQHGQTPLANAATKGDYAAIEELINESLGQKPDGHQFNWHSDSGHVVRYMATTGG